MSALERVSRRILGGGEAATREEALALYEAPFDALTATADRIREAFCAATFDLCTIVNARSGRCSEDCRFCAQSSHYDTGVEQYERLETHELVEQAQYNAARGVLRYSLVTSGRTLSPAALDEMCRAVEAVRAGSEIAVCVSFGLLDEAAYRRLRAAGATRVHNNLEASRRFFPEICTTHSYDDKLEAIRAAQAAGLEVCSGGIIGLGETVADRIDMALELRGLGIRSVPLNLLNPIPGTPLAAREPLPYEDFVRTVAVYRLLLPDAAIRLAGGRGLMPDGGASCFRAGANATITGDMLTTPGLSIASDRDRIAALGYEIGALE